MVDGVPKFVGVWTPPAPRPPLRRPRRPGGRLPGGAARPLRQHGLRDDRPRLPPPRDARAGRPRDSRLRQLRHERLHALPGGPRGPVRLAGLGQSPPERRRPRERGRSNASPLLARRLRAGPRLGRVAQHGSLGRPRARSGCRRGGGVARHPALPVLRRHGDPDPDPPPRRTRRDSSSSTTTTARSTGCSGTRRSSRASRRSPTGGTTGSRRGSSFGVLGRGEITVGLDVDSYGGKAREERPPGPKPLGDFRFRNTAAYAGYQHTFGDAVKITPSAGIRYTDSKDFGGHWGGQAGVRLGRFRPGAPALGPRVQLARRLGGGHLSGVRSRRPVALARARAHGPLGAGLTRSLRRAGRAWSSSSSATTSTTRCAS